MKFTTASLATAMLAGIALAAPRPGLAERLEQRGVLQRSSQPAGRIDNSDKENGILLKEGSDANVQYSNNWAGVVRESPPASATYSAVSATFTVPDPTATDNSGDMQAASVWVGIDGDTYTKAILQTGIDSYVQNGEKTYDAWYEWYPNSAENFDIDLSAGDVIVATVKSSSPSKGVAIIENMSSGKTVTKTLTAPSSDATLAGQNAEWIVEDFNAGSSQVPFAKFGTVTFTGAQAETDGGAYGVNNAEILDIQQGGKLLAEVNIESDTQFSVTYE
ncbi:transcriptional regulator family: Fungal Specific TF [Penicillium atrosanguineum]|uniref:transcriptional regulator family: Fungal Specific TF n=1 Tax=Penicillium atrosanguineum TaxID=1132637 RepID=UPI00238967EA|nr:transcriptional regulator family: Fungal Specific TF [Penicillium atrosanguineum]KAJ5300339.1 transcriptional regulator family: Fungal Specific TF [Penicillium atrosanguineum]